MTQHPQILRSGTGYDWGKQPDGRYTIKGIPIFHATVDNRGRKSTKYGPDYLRQVIDRQNSDQAIDHYPTVFVGHNTHDGDEKEPVGKLANFREGQFNNKLAIYTDIIDMEPEAFEAFQKEKLPHHSVEIPDPTIPRFGGLAFLSSRAPYFTFPNNKPGKRVFKTSNSPAFFHAQNTTEILFAQEIFMDDEKKKEIHLALMEGDENKEEFMEDPQMDNQEEFIDGEEMPAEEGGDDKFAALEARIAALEEAIAPSKDETPDAVADVDESAGMSAGSGLKKAIFQLTKAVKQHKDATDKRLNTIFSHLGTSQLNGEIQKAINHFTANNVAYGDPQTFASECHQRNKEGGIKSVQNYIRDIESFAPRFNGGVQMSATPSEIDDYTKDYTGEEREVAREAAQFALSKGDDPKQWIPGAVSEFRVTKQRPVYMSL